MTEERPILFSGAMARALSRILLEVAGVRAERLNDCGGADAIAENLIRFGDAWRGAPDLPWFASPVAAYASLWDNINDAGVVTNCGRTFSFASAFRQS